jgi:membrane-bound serine protease (ClpP class)
VLRTLPRASLAAAGLAAALLAAAPAGAQEPAAGVVDVVEVTGLLDPVVVDFVERALDGAAGDGSVAVVLRVDSGGGVVGDAEIDALLDAVRSSPVPVAAWVGPSGATAKGDAARLVLASEVSGMAPGTTIGDVPAGAGGDVPPGLVEGTVPAAEAAEAGVVDLGPAEAPVVGDFIVALPGVESRVVDQGDERRREPVTTVRFARLTPLDQLFHTVASPSVAYLLLAAGLLLIVFELYTGGIGVAGGVGAVAVVLAAYGLAVLPTSPVGLALVVLAMFGFAVDVQTGVPRVWTGIGTVAFALGSLLLFDDPVSLSWVALVVGLLGVLLMVLGGIPAVVRSRFSTPTVGREWMVGETGEAVTAVAPDGVVRVRGAPWRARTNRATPIDEGQAVKVASIDGLLLEVEPIEGAARDYRDRRPRREPHPGERPAAP